MCFKKFQTDSKRPQTMFKENIKYFIFHPYILGFRITINSKFRIHRLVLIDCKTSFIYIRTSSPDCQFVFSRCFVNLTSGCCKLLPLTLDLTRFVRLAWKWCQIGSSDFAWLGTLPCPTYSVHLMFKIFLHILMELTWTVWRMWPDLLHSPADFLRACPSDPPGPLPSSWRPSWWSAPRTRPAFRGHRTDQPTGRGCLPSDQGHETSSLQRVAALKSPKNYV